MARAKVIATLVFSSGLLLHSFFFVSLLRRVRFEIFKNSIASIVPDLSDAEYSLHILFITHLTAAERAWKRLSSGIAIRYKKQKSPSYIPCKGCTQKPS